jgi:hypothetical protein
VFTIKSNHGLSKACYDIIVKWARNILSEGNKLKENLYATKSIMKPLGLGYKKIDMCLNFCILCYLENAELTEYRTCGHSRYKPKTNWEMTFIAHRKLRYFLITPRLQRLFMSWRLLSIWHSTNHMMRWMEWWYTFPVVKPSNTLTICILIF